MDESYVIVSRNVVGNLALGALALHAIGIPEEDIDELLKELASDEDVLTGITDFVEENAIGSFDINTLMEETNLG